MEGQKDLRYADHGLDGLIHGGAEGDEDEDLQDFNLDPEDMDQYRVYASFSDDSGEEEIEVADYLNADS
jgi:hypothetical protein